MRGRGRVRSSLAQDGDSGGLQHGFEAIFVRPRDREGHAGQTVFVDRDALGPSVLHDPIEYCVHHAPHGGAIDVGKHGRGIRSGLEPQQPLEQEAPAAQRGLLERSHIGGAAARIRRLANGPDEAEVGTE